MDTAFNKTRISKRSCEHITQHPEGILTWKSRLLNSLTIFSLNNRFGGQTETELTFFPILDKLNQS